MELDRNGLEGPTRSECIAALGSLPMGRVGSSMDAPPVNVPVNVVGDGGDLILPTGDATTTVSARRGQVVALEVDALDRAGQMGWSVPVRGRSRFVVDPSELERLAAVRDMGPPPWEPTQPS